MIGAFDIATSGLIAQRVRLNVIAGNIANLNSVSDRKPNGDIVPFQEKFVTLETDPNMETKNGAQGVKIGMIASEQREPDYRHDPTHPLAIKSGKWAGHVPSQNINLTKQFTDALTATRAYEANIGVIEVTKNMGQQALRILA